MPAAEKVAVRCPGCRKESQVSSRHVGKDGECRGCQLVFRLAPLGQEAPGLLADRAMFAKALALGVVLLGCGALMTSRLLAGTSEFVHGPRTDHWLVTLLGDEAFTVLSALVCLLLGAGALLACAAQLGWIPALGPRPEQVA